MASLCLLAEDGTMADQWELGPEPMAVGRDASADVLVDDGALSRRHFAILLKDGSYVLQDLDSQNGTWVDGRRAQTDPIPLRHHDCILAGRTLFLFSGQLRASDTDTPAPAAVLA